MNIKEQRQLRSVGVKRCNACSKVLPLNHFKFKRTLNTYDQPCRLCYNERRREARRLTTLHCSKCGRRALSEICYCCRTRWKPAPRQPWQRSCPDCGSPLPLRRRLCDKCRDNRQRIYQRQAQREKRHDPDFGHKIRADDIRRIEEWRKRNPDRVREAARPHRRFSNQIRKSRKADLPHDLTRAQWHDTLIHFGGRCAYCGELWHHQDHFVPLARSGGYTAGNMVPACKDCNQKKNATDPLAWLVDTHPHGLVKYTEIENFLRAVAQNRGA